MRCVGELDTAHVYRTTGIHPLDLSIDINVGSDRHQEKDNSDDDDSDEGRRGLQRELAARFRQQLQCSVVVHQHVSKPDLGLLKCRLAVCSVDAGSNARRCDDTLIENVVIDHHGLLERGWEDVCRRDLALCYVCVCERVSL